MIVPEFWAEARAAYRGRGGRLTLRRFGWSDTNESAAQAMAQRRLAEAMERLDRGDAQVEAREPRRAYNGADGVPIREQVLARQGEEVITRNSYGARCLNSPCALFADVDFEPADGSAAWIGALVSLGLIAALAAAWFGRWGWAVVLALGVMLLALPFTTAVRGLIVRARGGAERVARVRVARFVAAHPQWGLRVYRTPAGLRLLATHRPFDPLEAEVARFFRAVGTDRVYQRMCERQRCFRARLGAKPWRIGVPGRMRPRPGVWPIRPQFRALREQWVREYESRAAGYAACRYLESLGVPQLHPRLQEVIALHDRESGAMRPELPLA